MLIQIGVSMAKKQLALFMLAILLFSIPSYATAAKEAVMVEQFGMGTFALGDAMMTKPYVAGSAYINRMSDHCKSCAFHPKKTCPITRLYWAYLDRHAPSFEGNFRMKMAMNNLKRRSEEEKTKDKLAFEWVSHALAQNEKLSI